MNQDGEKLYSYSYLFVVTLAFSALATELFLLYLFVRGNLWVPVELILVGIAICTLFSALGQRLSKVNDIGRWIFFVSTVSSAVYYLTFVHSRIGGYLAWIFIYIFLSAYLGWFAFWELLGYVWTSATEMKISKKPIIIVGTISIIGILVIYLVSAYLIEIVSFLDTHPWAMTLIGVLMTLLGGIIIGRRTKKS